jgi:drug/metabolite transporter (DMT)-like permease
MSGIAWVLLLTLSILWGATFFFWKVLVEYLPPFTAVFGRVGIAALVLIVVLALRGETLPLTRAAWRRFAIMASLNNAIPFALIAYGETAIASGLASILNAATPLFTVLVAHVLTDDEKLTPLRVIGIGLGFLGVVVLVGPDLLGGLAASLLAEAACLIAAIAYAFAGVYGRRFGGISALTAATGQLVAATLLMLPLVLVVDRPWRLPSPPGMVWASLVATAVLCTVAGYPVYFRLLAIAGATNLLLVTFLLPITSLMLGAMLLGEAITPEALLGMVLIGLGLASIDGRLVPRPALRVGSSRATVTMATGRIWAWPARRRSRS